MRKQILFIVCLFVSMGLNAQRITEQQAFQKAQQFMQGKVFQHHKMSRVKGRALPVATQSLYIFNVEDDGGFVIVSGDERTDAILGYSTQGNIVEGNTPPALCEWLDQTAEAIDALQNSIAPLSTDGQIRPQKNLRRVMTHPKIEPLILTEWNQGNYGNVLNSDGVYNIHLPMIDGKYPCTGCVATVGAQVMYYYQWPQSMTQVVSGYENGNANVNTSDDLPAIEFQWSKMKTQYITNDPDEDAVNAVADLMLYCGYAAKMKYGVNASGASTSTLAKGLCEFFDYNPNTWKRASRDCYSVSEWDELIYHELACGRPVIYSGSYDGGHAFICDGYDGEGMYHFNWGWGGHHNGYFKLQVTNPNGESDIKDMGYIEDNYCIIGLQPNSWPAFDDPNADDTWDEAGIEGLVATAGVVSEDDGMVTMWFRNYNEETCSFGFGFGELNEDGSITPVDITKEGYKNVELPEGWGFSTLQFNFASYELPEGTHALVPISLLNGETEWKRCRPVNFYFDVQVVEGEKTITAHPLEKIAINDFSLVKGSEIGYQQVITLNVTNEGDNLDTRMYVYVGTEDNVGESANYCDMKIASGNTKEYRIYIGELDAGTYMLRLLNRKDEVLATTEVTIEQDLRAVSFDFVGKKYVDRIQKVDVTVENHAGDYAVPLYLFASTTDTKTFVYAAGTAIERGSSEVVSFYFKPDVAGTWNVWVATDKDGTNIIGQSTVEISETYEANLSVTAQVQNVVDGVIKAENIVVAVDVRNDDEHTYDDVIEVDLYQWDEEAHVGHWIATQKQEITLDPSTNTSLDFTFDNFEDGNSYICAVYYYSKNQSVYATSTYRYEFRYTPKPSFVIGDVNGDGSISVTDVGMMISFILGQNPAGFNEDAADLNGDAEITVTDVGALITKILSNN